ncbi:MAG: hypothetical protein ABMA25_11490, partial [Ilumatobacteraceae bacterium]
MFGFSLNPIDWFTDAAGGIVGGAADAVFNFFLDLVMEALDWLARQIASLFVNAGRPVFGDGAASTSSLMLYVALAVVIGSAMLQAGLTVFRPSASSMSTLVDLPVTVIALGSVYAIAAVWLSATDAIAEAVLTDAVRESFSAGLQMDTAIVPFMRLIMALLMVLFMLLLFVEQLIRAHLLAVVIVMLPIGVAARVWEPARYVAAAMIKIFIALSLTPILTGVSMSLALANFTSAGPLDFVRMLGAIAGMAVTTLMPFMIFKLFPIGADGGGGVGLAAVGGAVGAASMGSSVAGKFGGAARDATSSGGSGGGSAAGAGAAAAVPAVGAAAAVKEAAVSTVKTAATSVAEPGGGGGGSGGTAPEMSGTAEA